MELWEDVDFEGMYGVVVEPFCRAFGQGDVSLYFDIDLFLFLRLLHFLLRLILGGLFGDLRVIEEVGSIADESDLFDESVGHFVLGGLRRRSHSFGFWGRRLLFFEGVEGIASCGF